MMNIKDSVTLTQETFQDTASCGDLPTQTSKYELYSDFVAEKVNRFPEHVIILLPYEESNIMFQAVQLSWMSDFWKEQKNLSV
tara:strand:- start:43 stop:291 length:249 start_codon:yes stop_codon:yes gene_type:complete